MNPHPLQPQQEQPQKQLDHAKALKTKENLAKLETRSYSIALAFLILSLQKYLVNGDKLCSSSYMLTATLYLLKSAAHTCLKCSFKPEKDQDSLKRKVRFLSIVCLIGGVVVLSAAVYKLQHLLLVREGIYETYTLIYVLLMKILMKSNYKRVARNNYQESPKRPAQSQPHQTPVFTGYHHFSQGTPVVHQQPRVVLHQQPVRMVP